MEYKILLAERATGIILNADAQSRHISGRDLPYLFFDSLAEALAFANASVEADRTLEVSIWNEEGNYEQTVIAKTH